jgi:hypothetical protein
MDISLAALQELRNSNFADGDDTAFLTLQPNMHMKSFKRHYHPMKTSGRSKVAVHGKTGIKRHKLCVSHCQSCRWVAHRCCVDDTCNASGL